ncbi:MAG: hypothetical protein V4603_16985, partial [Pseudomonadota bacterium]
MSEVPSMIPAPLPANEGARLLALHRLQILDTDPEPPYDNLTAIAAGISGCAIALISLMDVNRQWFKAKCGIDICETERDLAFCSHAILHREILEVPDAKLDPR